jgi:D-alanine-D-alanine ligase
MDSTVRGVPADVTRLILVYGGRSAEHDVSCSTALHVLRAVAADRYDVTAIGISTDGEWFQLDSESLSAARSGMLTALPICGTAIMCGDIGVNGAANNAATVVFPLLHGPLGEDGTMQGLLEVLDVPYVGSGVLGSALAMDKAMAKLVCAADGIPQAKHLVLRDRPRDVDGVSRTVEQQLGFPCFVKPANMGSSIGVARATTTRELARAIDDALTYDRMVLVEEAIVGREIEVAVLGNDEPQAFGPGEVIPADVFYSYADKYLDGRSTVMIPADLPHEVADQARELALRAFQLLRCSGLARCDFFFEEHGRGLLLNEVNTMPGFTPISMYPKMVISSGIGYSDLIDRLVDLALAHHAAHPRRVDRG